jgi:hypothetical protein
LEWPYTYLLPERVPNSIAIWIYELIMCPKYVTTKCV